MSLWLLCYTVSMDCTVTIPKDNEHYSLYAEGIFIRKTVTEQQSFITLNDDFCITLYYTVHTWRHLYVCVATRLFPDYPHTFNESDAQLSVIADLTGRAYDRFKRSMHYLNVATLGAFYRFPPSFFWQLASLCRFGKNNRLNLRLLVYQYDKTIIIPERIQWK